VATGLGSQSLIEAASDLVIRRPSPPPAPAVVEQPTPHLAEALFNQAAPNASPIARPWVVTEAPAANVNDLDVPAFLRRRRPNFGRRDFQGGK
jgi:hypothetical protein